MFLREDLHKADMFLAKCRKTPNLNNKMVPYLTLFILRYQCCRCLNRPSLAKKAAEEVRVLYQVCFGKTSLGAGVQH